jgi:hypothetical protein
MKRARYISIAAVAALLSLAWGVAQAQESYYSPNGPDSYRPPNEKEIQAASAGLLNNSSNLNYDKAAEKATRDFRFLIHGARTAGNRIQLSAPGTAMILTPRQIEKQFPTTPPANVRSPVSTTSQNEPVSVGFTKRVPSAITDSSVKTIPTKRNLESPQTDLQLVQTYDADGQTNDSSAETFDADLTVVVKNAAAAMLLPTVGLLGLLRRETSAL